MTIEVSNLWRSLCKDVFSGADDEFIKSFRRPGGANNRLAAWDPLDRSMRYFKFLLFTAAQRQPERFFDLYRSLGKVDIGAPVSVTVGGCEINIDYYLSVDEFMFLEAAGLDRVSSIVEIGAGFGRTCHALLSLSSEGVKEYCIVDLPEVLELSRRVLQQVVPEHYGKIRFVDATDTESWKGLSADLAINVDSFQEMLPGTIDAYMQGLIANCRYFYVKNPIGKYDPATVGILNVDAHKLQDVFSLGFCREVIDIFNDESLSAARPRYIEAYSPGLNWDLVAERPMDMFPYYHHALCARR